MVDTAVYACLPCAHNNRTDCPPLRRSLSGTCHDEQRVIAEVFLRGTGRGPYHRVGFSSWKSTRYSDAPCGISYRYRLSTCVKSTSQTSHVDREIWISVAHVLEGRFCELRKRWRSG